MTEILERLLRKLKAPEWLHTELMRMQPVASSMNALAGKLSHIEGIVTDIPDQYTDLIEEWREKVVTLWAMYCSAEYIASVCSSSNTTEKEKFLSNLVASPPSSAPSGSATPTHSQQSNQHFFCPSPSFTTVPFNELPSMVQWYQTSLPYEQQKMAVIEEFKVDFGNLPQIAHNYDIEPLKQLLTLIANAEKEVRPFRDEDQQVEERVFDIALGKFTREKQLDFWKWSDNKETKLLRKLKIYVSNQIGNYLARLNPNDPGRIRPPSGESKDQCCVYCKMPDHQLQDCDQRFQTQCFKCDQFGHIVKHCRN